MTWLKLDPTGLYLMESNSDKYLEKRDISRLNDTEFKTTIPANWFTDPDLRPGNLIINLQREGFGAKPAQKGFNRYKFALLAEKEASKNLVWHPGGAAIKYTEPFKIYFGNSRFPWCGAFIHWLLNQHGVLTPTKTWDSLGNYTFALVENWQHVAKVRNWYYDHNGFFKPEPGDLVLFDWEQTDIDEKDDDFEDHIGVFLGMEGAKYKSAEGNTRKGNIRNISNVCLRNSSKIQGFIRIPEGTIKI